MLAAADPDSFAAREQSGGLAGGQSLPFASLPPLPSVTGVERELFCRWKFPFDRCCFANCHFCFERSVEEFAVLLCGWELPDVKKTVSPPGSSRGEFKARDSM